MRLILLGEPTRKCGNNTGLRLLSSDHAVADNTVRHDGGGPDRVDIEEFRDGGRTVGLMNGLNRATSS